MKSVFSKGWVASVQARKQRKYRYNAPLHIKKKFIRAHLSQALRKQYNTRAVTVRKGDTVKVLRGSFKGTTGKVDRVSLQYERIFVQGVERAGTDGAKKMVPLRASNVLITALDTSDKKRFEQQQDTKENKK
ncbi:MAG: 50S ribosomal protein L24 [Candidatus Woesearchaeota archaeon]